MSLDRRDFLKVAGAHASLIAATPAVLEASLAERRPPAALSRAADVVVIGAGAWGGWTAFYLRELGANVTLVDQYGPGNARATSGDESRGIRSSYGQREQWVRWASQAIERWKRWDEEWSRPLRMQLFFTTGDVILRAEWEPFLDDTKKSWDRLGIRYEQLTADEVKYRWPVIGTEGMTVALFETDAGVARARRSCEAVAEVVRQKGGTILIGRAALGGRTGNRLNDITLTTGEPLRADAYVFACGPWLPKALPDVMTNRMRLPMGYVFYYGVPPEDARFTFPNLPSYNFPGVTGWPALPPDHRGFRVRGGGGTGPGAGVQDPDLSDRWVDSTGFERQRRFLEQRFPLLKDAPIVQTHACHYESTVSRNFIVDRHPDLENVWIAGGGNAEGFKMGPVIGEYIAQRVLQLPTDPALDEQFKLAPGTFETRAPGEDDELLQEMADAL
jgi:glycine/D-amino acid oxidase-like deaminating enzyme